MNGLKYNRLGFRYVVWRGGIQYRTHTRKDAIAYATITAGMCANPGVFRVYRQSKRTDRSTIIKFVPVP